MEGDYMVTKWRDNTTRKHDTTALKETGEKIEYRVQNQTAYLLACLPFGSTQPTSLPLTPPPTPPPHSLLAKLLQQV